MATLLGRLPVRLLLVAGILGTLLPGPACRTAAPQALQPTRPLPEEPVHVDQLPMRMPWQPASKGFIRTWLVLGPLPSKAQAEGITTRPPARAGFDLDLLGDEPGAAPQPGQTVTAAGVTRTWRQYESPREIVNFKAAFDAEPLDNAIGYAFATIRRDHPGQALLAVGSDDSIKIYLNGKLVHDHPVARGAHADEDVVPVELAAGDNRLLLKVENLKGGWGAVVRVLEPHQISLLDAEAMLPAILTPPAPDVRELVIHTDQGVGRLLDTPQPVTVTAVAPGGAELASRTVDRGQLVRFQTADWPDGPCEIRLRLNRPGRKPLVRHLPWMQGPWRKDLCRVVLGMEDVRAHPDEESLARKWLLYRFVLTRLGPEKCAQGPGDEPHQMNWSDWPKIHGPWMEYLEHADGTAVRPHGFVRLFWVDPVDGSGQFCRAYLPPDYDPAKAWPMVVMLHGYNPRNPEYVDWWGQTKRHADVAERHGVIFLEPHGRGNTGYSGIGQADVLRAIAEASKTFAVDRDRIYLMGYSMGGGGTWHIGTRHPGLFAAIGPVYGGWDYRVWMSQEEIDELTELERYLQESDSGFAQAEALLHTPVFVNHGDADELVEVEQSRYAVRMLQRWGYPVRYWEHPRKGHEMLGEGDRLIPWFLRNTLRRNPRTVRLRAADIASARAEWIAVEAAENPWAFLRAEAEILNPRQIRLDTDNALQVRLTPPAELVGKQVSVIWNGQAQPPAPGNAVMLLRAPGYRPGETVKTPTLCGPIKRAKTTPFAIVCGTTANDPRMRAFVRYQARRARAEWKQWQKVPPRYFLDTEITDSQIRRYSLLLIGGPEANAVTAKLADALPVRVRPGRLDLGDQKLTGDLACKLVYPHPLDDRRYVVLSAATSPDAMFYLDRLPENGDFVVSDLRWRPGGWFSDDKQMLVGRFDAGWTVDDRYIYREQVRRPDDRLIRKAPRFVSVKEGPDSLQLSQLLPLSAEGSLAAAERGMTADGRPLRVGGKIYAHGLGAELWHEPNVLYYDLSDGGYRRLRGVFDFDTGKGPDKLAEREKHNTRVFLVVRGDGKELYRSPTLRWDSEPVTLDLDITGVKGLEIEIDNETTWFATVQSVNLADLRIER